METMTATWTDSWSEDLQSLTRFDDERTLGLVFAVSEIEQDALLEVVRAFPKATIVGCSTSGQISEGALSEAPAALTLIRFEHVVPAAAMVHHSDVEQSVEAGKALGRALMSSATSPIRDVLLLSKGLHVNGSEVVAGFTAELPEAMVSGGLAGDDNRFDRTWVMLNGEFDDGGIAAISLGDSLNVTHGSSGGWEGFGPSRTVTRSAGNVLFELDGTPALALYKEYLGELAAGLPGNALMFPLNIESPDKTMSFVRTVLNIDEADNSMTFAGDIPTGWTARLMRTTQDRLVNGAYTAATQAAQAEESVTLAISCVGRRLMMGERTDEELDAVIDGAGESSLVFGFYSYGEITPSDGLVSMQNQTMTITTISEPGSDRDMG